MSDHPLKIFSELADKPIFTERVLSDDEQIKDSYNETKVSADLFCVTCGRVKTFSGSAYGYSDYLSAVLRQVQANEYPVNYGTIYGKNENEQIETELSLPFGNSVTIKTECPVCKSPAYFCYVLEKESCYDKDSKREIGCSLSVVKIGEYPDQNISRLQLLSNYANDFPTEYSFLAKAERSYGLGFGAGSIIYLRKSYESLLFRILAENEVDRPSNFKQTLEEADKVAKIVPIDMKDHAYGLFGEMSDLIHGDADDKAGLDKYELLRDILKIILDNIREKNKQAELIMKIKPDNSAKRGQ
ncbi:MAG: hypothetical protein LBJ20_00225 [Candidatus Methanoplasma sp.]|jgi:hypothetical protein|nr:hypothetical protein [Candidatus Methanoplasma sp.]